MARAISVYLSFYISNKLVFFKNEPDVPLKWQHILNWGGLRGVIPLVLAYSIPDSYLYKNYVLSFTLATLVFTLLINALTIRWLLVKLGLHLPKKEEEILKEQLEIFDVEKRRDLLADLPERDFYKELVDIASVKLDQEEQYHKKKLLELANTQELENSLRLQAIEITRDKIFNLYHKGYISESIVYEYDSQLDLQQDAVEYPEVYFGRGYGKGGRIPNQKIFRQKLRSLDQLVRNFPTLRKFWGQKENDLILKRLMLLKTKIICVDEIIDYLDKVESLVKENKEACGGVEVVLSEYYARKEEYEINLTNLKEQYPDVVRNYQYDLLHVLLAIK